MIGPFFFCAPSTSELALAADLVETLAAVPLTLTPLLFFVHSLATTEKSLPKNFLSNSLMKHFFLSHFFTRKNFLLVSSFFPTMKEFSTEFFFLSRKDKRETLFFVKSLSSNVTSRVTTNTWNTTNSFTIQLLLVSYRLIKADYLKESIELHRSIGQGLLSVLFKDPVVLMRNVAP